MSKDKWQEKIQNIEEGFIPYLPKEEGYEKTVLEAVNYSIENDKYFVQRHNYKTEREEK